MQSYPKPYISHKYVSNRLVIRLIYAWYGIYIWRVCDRNIWLYLKYVPDIYLALYMFKSGIFNVMWFAGLSGHNWTSLAIAVLIMMLHHPFLTQTAGGSSANSSSSAVLCVPWTQANLIAIRVIWKTFLSTLVSSAPLRIFACEPLAW